MAKSSLYLLIVLVVVLIYLMDFTIVSTVQSNAKKGLVLHSLQCDGERKSWLEQVATYSINELDYLNLQLSYIDSKGRQSACTAGWEGLPYLTRSVTRNTVLNYASVTKIFTAELILDLVRKQQISLNDNLVNFLPEIKSDILKDARVADITISDLLSHRAGFDRSTTNDTMVSPSPWCPYNVNTLQHITLDFDPNSKKVYSNVGYCLLAKVIENVYAKDYNDISRDYFNFDDSDIRFIQRSMIDQPKIPDISNDDDLGYLDFYALASVGGLTGSSHELARYVYDIDRITYPNVTSRAKRINCDIGQVRGCHGFSGYEYGPDERLTLYWRDGRLPKASALVAMDSDGGVLSFLSSSESDTNWLNYHEQLVKFVYEMISESY